VADGRVDHREGERGVAQLLGQDAGQMQGIGMARVRGQDGSVQFPGESQPTGLVVLDGALQEIVHHKRTLGHPAIVP
jgi:hypothetical protein